MSRDFGKVRVKFWADERVSAWPERLKFVALYLLTSEHSNALGCFRLPAQYAAADTGLSVKDLNAAFADLEREGFLKRCDKTGWTFLTHYLIHNPIENGKVGTHCISLGKQVPQSIPFLKDMQDALIEALRAINVVWVGFGYPIDTLSKPDRSPEPEPEPEMEPSSEAKASAVASAPAKAPSASKPNLQKQSFDLGESLGIARPAVGSMAKKCGYDWTAVHEVLSRCRATSPADPTSWCMAEFQPHQHSPPPPSKPSLAERLTAKIGA